MAILRLLAGGLWAAGSPIGADRYGRPVLHIGEGETVTLTVDATGRLGSATISASTFAASGATLAGAATSGQTASVRISVSAGAETCGEVVHTLTTSATEIIVTTILILSRMR